MSLVRSEKVDWVRAYVILILLDTQTKLQRIFWLTISKITSGLVIDRKFRCSNNSLRDYDEKLNADVQHQTWI